MSLETIVVVAVIDIKNAVKKSFWLFKNGATPVYIAAQNGHVDALRLLLEAKGDPNNAHKVICIIDQAH